MPSKQPRAAAQLRLSGLRFNACAHRARVMAGASECRRGGKTMRLIAVLLALLCLAPQALAVESELPSQRKILVHVPVFVMADDTAIEDSVSAFASATLGFRPTSDEMLQLDVLLVFTGAQPDNMDTLGSAISARLPPSSKVFVEWLHLEDATYDKSRSSKNWTMGPNSEFYAIMKEGTWPLARRGARSALIAPPPRRTTVREVHQEV